jgi:hypothetical protein
MMRYPTHMTQPYDGSPFPYDQGPPDALPSQHNPYYDLYATTRGRFLGSLGGDGAMTDVERPVPPKSLPSADGPDRRDYPNELNTLAELDDVQANGIFDAPGTHGNIHPDAGIFADRESLPGYLAREKFFQPSEVRDITNGEPVMFVPGNGFMVDPRTAPALAELSLYIPGLPSTGGRNAPAQSIVVPRESAWSVGADEPLEPPPEHKPASAAKMFLVAGIAGLAIGLVIGIAK